MIILIKTQQNTVRPYEMHEDIITNGTGCHKCNDNLHTLETNWSDFQTKTKGIMLSDNHCKRQS